jgi:hypothetical protein
LETASGGDIEGLFKHSELYQQQLTNASNDIDAMKKQAKGLKISVSGTVLCRMHDQSQISQRW